nr:MAG TPA: hypothetical protein [Caudoviricetes sp.]
MARVSISIISPPSLIGKSYHTDKGGQHRTQRCHTLRRKIK